MALADTIGSLKGTRPADLPVEQPTKFELVINMKDRQSSRAHDSAVALGSGGYKKDDNAHIEQKNWTHVRKLLGYVRDDRPAAQAAIHALYRHELRLFQNLVQPSVKLVRKERVGPRLRRRYDAPHTPLERVLAWPGIEARVAAELQRQRDRVDPFALARAIDQQLERIYALANPRHSAPSSSGGPAAVSVPRRMRHRLSIKPAASRRPSPSVASQVARRFLLRSHSQMA